MDIHFELNGASFIWNDEKARLNVVNHDGITFMCAAEVFFDPFFLLLDASRNGEARDAVIGYDTRDRLLVVVHVVFEDEAIRIISARKATTTERNDYDS
ncbi:MAG: BrnT family toxin [Xanthomonadales bacterium]|nr:BrnT family toxin [Xanthomonadales bacterium]